MSVRFLLVVVVLFDMVVFVVLSLEIVMLMFFDGRKNLGLKMMVEIL